jgi:phosphatidylglycerophosphatase A
MRKAIVSVVGLGYLPIAPGTWGSFGACLAAVLLWWVLGAGVQYHVVLAALTVLSVGGCVVLGDWAIKFYGSGDPKAFVLDEVAGQWVALIALPCADPKAMLLVLFMQFVLFRVADIFKPPPARQLERLPAGWGIVFDDLAAGVYANIAGQLILRLLWVA